MDVILLFTGRPDAGRDEYLFDKYHLLKKLATPTNVDMVLWVSIFDFQPVRPSVTRYCNGKDNGLKVTALREQSDDILLPFDFAEIHFEWIIYVLTNALFDFAFLWFWWFIKIACINYFVLSPFEL